MDSHAVPAVDFVTNVYERTYFEALQPARFAELAGQHEYPFAEVTILLSNTHDPARSKGMAQKLIGLGLATRLLDVHELRNDAYRRTGISARAIAAVAPFTDFGLVAVTAKGPDLVLHWDPELDLERGGANWIHAAVRALTTDHRVAVASPSWGSPTLASETLELSDGFVLTHGFSDQAFLCRRSEFGQPIYNTRCTAQLRYPLAEQGAIFEARVDAYMRHAGRLRAVVTGATYSHPPATTGMAHELPNVSQRIRGNIQRAVRRGLLHRSIPANCYRDSVTATTGWLPARLVRATESPNNANETASKVASFMLKPGAPQSSRR